MLALQLATSALIAASGVMWAVVATSDVAAPAGRPRWRSAAPVALTVSAVAAVGWTWAAGGWWFVGEKVLVFAPLAVAAVLWFIATLLPRRNGTRRAHSRPGWQVRAAAWAGVIAAAAGLIMQFAVGFPAPAWSIIAMLLVAVGASALVALLLHGDTRRPLATAISGIGALAVIGTIAMIAGIAPVGISSASSHAGHGAVQADADAPAVAGEGTTVPVTALRTPASGVADVRVELDAQQQRVTLPSGVVIDAWTFGELGGPLIEATEGDLVEVVLRNRDIDAGVTVHWHGYPVPNGEDGVAGVTQDAVRPGEEFTYRFVATRPGTYWYHTHQRSSAGVPRGLYGPLVVHADGEERADVDVVLPLHTFEGAVVLGDSDEPQTMPVSPGQTVRVRLINTDQVPQVLAVSGAGFRIVAIDGHDVRQPALLADQALRIPAGGRYDVAFEVADAQISIRPEASGTASVTFPPGGDAEKPAAQPAGSFDPLQYGTAAAGAWDGWRGPFDVDRTVVLDRLPRLLEGGPAYAYTVDGRAYPDVEPTTVHEGDLVRLTVVNRGFETHPMHPHGHSVRVLSVNGQAPSGSPLVLDTFDVRPGETWVVGFVADNPGIWMNHCHNLDHAALGMVTHLEYAGVTSPFDHGGAAKNAAE
ncbi:multicopper oxidase family protein [Microbacterium sp. SD291]|uniref:multicopper oxidase family protein n=1 Tax=Microbacterium sp. SD291 TaxID=2782007 RepID=UPI001A958DAE|nr:multicopper oxidase family protein [Microbacterium sp. SD291]MBO0981659.1 multicopper oxidase family protein [Microbacterium sp. SD291]